MSNVTVTANEQAYRYSKARERRCAVWLKARQRTVRPALRRAAAAGIVNGVLLIVQMALLAELLQKLLIDRQAVQSVSYAFAALLVLSALRAACGYGQQLAGFSAAARVKQTVRGALNARVAELGPAYLQRQSSGALSHVLVDQVEALEPYFARYLPQQYIAVAVPALIMLVMLPINWVVALIFLVTGPLVPIFMALIGMGAASASQRQFLQTARMSGYFLDRLQGLATLRLFNRAHVELQALNDVADDLRERTLAVLRIAFLSSAVLEFFSAVAVALVAVYVGLGLLGLIRFGPAATVDLQGALFALLLAPEFFAPLKLLAAYYHDRAAALAAADAINNLLDEPLPAGITPEPGGGRGSLDLCGVGKRFGGRSVLDSIDWRIEAGEHWLLTGETGAGKSTLLNLLLAFDTPDSGTICLQGQPLTRDRARVEMAWVGQQPALFHGSLADNISLFDPDVAPQAVQAAAEAAGVTEFSRDLPNGLQTLVGERGYGLSGGQLQRLALARAFLQDASIVLLDEPTAHLDETGKRHWLQSLQTLFERKTVIVASHDPLIIGHFAKRVHLAQGRLQ